MNTKPHILAILKAASSPMRSNEIYQNPRHPAYSFPECLRQLKELVAAGKVVEIRKGKQAIRYQLAAVKRPVKTRDVTAEKIQGLRSDLTGLVADASKLETKIRAALSELIALQRTMQPTVTVKKV